MKSKSLYILIALVLTMLSCNRQKNEKPPIFDSIENLIETDVDSALILLNHYYTIVDSTQQNIAYYNLLISEANSKNANLTWLHDSLLDYSIVYFKQQNDIDLYAKALLYKGRLWAQMNQNRDALVNYYKLLDIVNKISDYKTISRIYDDLGNLYVSEGLYSDAILMFQNGYKIDSLHGSKDNMILSLTNIARGNLYLNDTDEYERLMLEAYEISETSNEPKKNRSYLDYLYSIYFIEISDYNEALKYISNSINEHKYDEDIFTKYLIKGEILNIQNRYDSACYYLDKCLESEKLYTKTLAYYELSLLHKSQNHFEKALEYTDLYKVGMDSITYLTFNTETQALVYKYNVEKAVAKVTSENKIILLVVIVVFSIIIMIAVIVYNIRDKRVKLQNKEKEKEALKNKADILQKEVEIGKLKREMDLLKNNISEYHLLESKIKRCNELIEFKELELLNLLYKEIDEQCLKFKKTKIYQKILELSIQEKDKNYKILTYVEQNELLKQVKLCFPRLINELEEKYSFLNDEDIIICCLSIFKLSNHVISLCFAVSGANTIKQRKHRIKKRMFEAPENSFLYPLLFPEKK